MRPSTLVICAEFLRKSSVSTAAVSPKIVRRCCSKRPLSEALLSSGKVLARPCFCVHWQLSNKSAARHPNQTAQMDAASLGRIHASASRSHGKEKHPALPHERSGTAERRTKRARLNQNREDRLSQPCHALEAPSAWHGFADELVAQRT